MEIVAPSGVVLNRSEDDATEHQQSTSPMSLLQESLYTCTTYWFNKVSPNPEQLTEEEAIETLKCQIETYKTRQSEAENGPESTELEDFECSTEQAARIVRRCKLNPIDSYREWEDWVTWRRSMQLHTAKDADFADLAAYGIASWKGHDREGRPCLVLTGRLLDPQSPKPRNLFKRYVAYIAEKGMHICNQENVEKCVILYDRRGMGFEHINTGLVSAVQPELRAVSRFYKDRVSVIYILHLNILWRVLYSAIVIPALWLVSSVDKLLIFQSVHELDDYFEKKDLGLASFCDQDETDIQSASPDSTSQEGKHVEI